MHHLTWEFDEYYLATGVLKICHLIIYTTRGPINLNVIDTAGHEFFGAVQDKYFYEFYYLYLPIKNYGLPIIHYFIGLRPNVLYYCLMLPTNILVKDVTI